MRHAPCRWPALVLATCLMLPLSGAGAQTAQSLEDLTATAEQGSPGALFALGERYHAGTGVLQSYAQAAKWFARAGALDHAPSQNRLGLYYLAGLGVAQDRSAALGLLEAAAATGEAQFQFDLARAYEAESESDENALRRAAELYAEAAGQGHLEATVSLGVLYQRGTGVPADPLRARQLYETAAAQGHARAQNNLGLLYVRGESVSQDYARASALFAAAAEQGLPVAMTNLAVMYENGFGVALDEARAAELNRLAAQGQPAAEPAATGLVYDPRLANPDTSEAGQAQLQQAARAGDPVAMFQLSWVLLTTQEQDVATDIRAAQMMRQAAQAGLAPAMVNLALLYFEGRGLHQDYVLAQMWLLRAGQAGQAGTTGLSAYFTDQMTAAQINEAQALAARP